MPKVYENYFGTSRAKGSFLASEVGLKLETRDFTSVATTLGTNVTDRYGKVTKVIKAGTVYPSNGNNAVGIVYQDCYPDVDGHYVGSLMTGGYVYEERLEVAIVSGAVTALKALGLYVLKAPVTTRPNYGSGELSQLSAPTVTVTSGTASWASVENATGYAVFLNDELVAITTSVSQAVAGKAGDVVRVQAQGDYVNYANSDFGTASWA